MWECCDKEKIKEFILSLELLDEGFSDKKKMTCLYSLSNNIKKHYERFKLKKKSGGYRTVMAPDFLLKKVQTNILRNILEYKEISEYATAYQKGKSIIDNAKPHINKKIILKLDIYHFFDNITFQMVKENIFPSTIYPPAVQTLLTNLCCYEGHIPQGAPTSAAISNILLTPFDKEISAWSQERNITYTRYCDDLTFSGDFDYKKVIQKIEEELNQLGFKLNDRKTKVISHHHRQQVTGLVVNKKINIQKKYRDEIRKEVYYIQKYGIKSHLNQKGITQIDYEIINKYLNTLLGQINYILMITPNNNYFKKIRKQMKEIQTKEREKQKYERSTN